MGNAFVEPDVEDDFDWENDFDIGAAAGSAAGADAFDYAETPVLGRVPNAREIFSGADIFFTRVTPDFRPAGHPAAPDFRSGRTKIY